MKFGIKGYKMSKGEYSLCFGISTEIWQGKREAYIFINLIKWAITIGRQSL